MNESNTNNYNNKEKELQENQTKELKEKELKEKEMKENQLKENEFINLKFIYNGNLTEEITIQCNKNDLIKDLIERYKMKKNINDDLHFFIWHNQKLKPELYVGQAYLRNNDTIVVIDTKDIVYA